MPIDPQRWRQLSPWLDQVLELPTEQRQGWLDELAGREPELAADLRSLLAGSAVGAGAQILQGAAPAVAMHGLAGRRIGAYTLLEPLGEGGMGAVWLAERSDGRFAGRAAVKLLRAGLVQRTLAERFRREGAILARLSHPHIARLVDAGLTDDGQPYLVLEHVAGERIDRWCDARRMDLRSRIVLFAQVLQAVQHAHVRLVVHRDLKPANVMVDGEGAVKLLDFGIAKLLDDEGGLAEATELTRDAGRVLTPLYAAPEQTRGDAVTTATDVYALGLLLYLLLTGQHPRVDAQGKGAADDAALPPARRVVNDPARRSDAELRAAAAARGTTPARLAHALAGDLDNILAKALRHEPGERYATVAAFGDDLQRHLDGHTVRARPDSLAYRASRFVGRHKAGVGLATAALVAIVVTAGVAEQQRRAAERDRDLATRQRINAEAVAQFVEEQLGQTDEPGLPHDPAARVDRAQRRAEQLFYDSPEVLVPLRDLLANLNFALGREQAGQRNLEAIGAVAAKIEDPVTRALALCLGRSLEASADQALARVDRALAGLPVEEGSRNVRSLCLFERSAALHEAGRYREALSDIEAANEVAPVLMRRMRETAYLRGKGLMLNELGQPHAADQAYARVVEQMHAAGRAPSIRLAQDLIWRAVFHWRMGRPREGLRLAEQATAMATPTGDAAASIPFVTLIHARLRFETDQPDEARRLWESVLLRDGRLVPPYKRYWEFVAHTHRLRGEHAAAVAVLERDLEEHGNAGHAVRDAINRVALADELLAVRDAPRALAVLRELDANPALQTFRWEAAWARARALNIVGPAAEAEAAARAAVAVAAGRSPPEGRSALHGHAYLELARALALQGRGEEARAAALRAADELADALGPEHSATRAATAIVRR